jgi:hypothetical protein
LYASPNIKVIKSRKMRYEYNILVGKSKGKRPLGRPRCRWEDIIMDVMEIGLEGMERMLPSQDRDQW